MSGSAGVGMGNHVEPCGMSKNRITSIESHHGSFGRIQFQDASEISAEKSLPFDPHIELADVGSRY
jgi:hypothetical protein